MIISAIKICEQNLENKSKEETFFTIRVFRSNKNYVLLETNNAVFSFVASPPVYDIISVMEYIFEKLRQEKGIYCIHGACTIYKKSAFIFWGGLSGIGKTRIAFELAKENNANFYSDEKVLLDLNTMEVCGGINKIYQDKKYWQNINPTIYNSKNNQRFNIAFMIQPIVEEMSRNIIWEAMSEKKFNWHLYEELSRKIRGVSRRIFDFSIPLESLDTESNAIKRIQKTNFLTSRINSFYAKGDSQKIIKQIKLCYE